jgi:hypothetical protein
VVGEARAREREGEEGGAERAERLWSVGRMGGAGPQGEESPLFKIFCFSNKFQTAASIQILSKKITFSGNGPKIKSYLEFNPLQLCFRDQLKILHRF